MSPDKKSKRQIRREKMQQQQMRSRLTAIALMVLGAAVVVLVFLYPSIRPITEVVSVDVDLPTTYSDNTMGDPNAPIKIEEYSDFQCPFCERFHTETEALLKQYYIDTGKVYFVYRSMGNWVSGNIAASRGVPAATESQDAAMAAYCAGEQNMFWEMHTHLFANVLGEDVGSFSDRRLGTIAETAGLNMDEFTACYESGKFEERTIQDFDDGVAAGVNGTPAFIITYEVNGETKTTSISGAQPFSAFQVQLEGILNEINAAQQ